MGVRVPSLGLWGKKYLKKNEETGLKTTVSVVRQRVLFQDPSRDSQENPNGRNLGVNWEERLPTSESARQRKS